MPIFLRTPASGRILLCATLLLLACFGLSFGQNFPPAAAGNGTRALIRITPDTKRPPADPLSFSPILRDGTDNRPPSPGVPGRPAWRWARDSFFKPSGGLRRDKIEHFAGSACLVSILRVYEVDEKPSVSSVVSAGFLWEVKDAVVPWERFGFWGGDGFSWRDLAADGLGIAAAVLVWRGP